MSAAQQHGTELRRGQFTGVVSRAEGPNAGGIEVDGNVIEADAVFLRGAVVRAGSRIVTRELRAATARFPPGKDFCTTSMLPSGDTRLPAADREGAARRRRLRDNRA